MIRVCLRGGEGYGTLQKSSSKDRHSGIEVMDARYADPTLLLGVDPY